MAKSKIPLKAGKLLILVLLLLVSAPVFAQSVDTAWVRRYNGTGDSTDWAWAIAVDNDGNVYVTGYSYGNGTGYDYATIKYFSDGDTAWVRRYNGPGNSQDYARAIAIDGSGDVYVTGYSAENTSYYYNYDFATIKYYPDGEIAWVRIYNGPGNGDDQASAVAIDRSGNVYVTGECYGDSGTYLDYATIKYYPNGDVAWLRRYNGEGNDQDWAHALAIDSSGNVYVSGQSYGWGTDFDYVTIKYYPNGDTAWLRRYSAPGSSYDLAQAIAIDYSDNVLVTGVSYNPGGTGQDYCTIKYDHNGDTVWVRRYDGPGYSYDWAWAVAVDGFNNVYVTGRSSNDIATIKYYSNGDIAWTKRYNGPGNDWDEASAIAVDRSDNVYVAGWQKGTGTDNDYVTIKYYPNGDTAWVRRYNGPGNSGDCASAIAIDGSCLVYETGRSMGSGTSEDYATIKYVQFLCGDVNKDGVVDVGDVVYLINYLFKNGPAPVPILKAGDASCDGVVDVGDAVYLINYLFKKGPEPCC
jgi:uncharacterized delta-60 repeat protein